jgi:hypothetical protein
MADSAVGSSHLTLRDAVKLMNDSGRTISYLKVDIEGFEIKAIPEWIGSGILDQVGQVRRPPEGASVLPGFPKTLQEN